MNIPFLDIRAQNASIREELDSALAPVIEQAQFILGPAVEAFEADFARYCGSRFCVGLNSGTSALHMVLAALDVGPGHEVITTPHTWISTSWAISYVGATPVFVDIDRDSFNIDPALVERAITPHTKAILPVHLYGRAADVIALRDIAARHDLLLIEDAAQAHGARVGGRHVGTFGPAGCFSFYPGKNLGAFGEAGAVITDDENLAARIRRLRDHAQDGRHRHVELGFNARMEGIHGAVLQVKLRHLDRWNALRRQHAEAYLANGIEVPLPAESQTHVWHLFVTLVDGDRDAFRERLAERGVATGVHYPTPVPHQPAYAHLGYQPGDFPMAEDVMNRCVSLPMHPEMTAEQVAYVANAVRECAL